MKIQVMSDLHLNFPENNSYIRNNNLFKNNATVLILAGDTAETHSKDLSIRAFFNDYVYPNYETVIEVPGNHSYYRASIKEILPTLTEVPILKEISCKHYYINNDKISLGLLNIYGTCLWSKVLPEHKEQVRGRLNDFRLITGMTLEKYNKEFEDSLEYLKGAIFPEDFNIVVTHHMPTTRASEKFFPNNSLNSAYSTDLEEFIKATNIKYWICGHSHYQYAEMIYGTQIICNPLGYVHLNEHKKFDKQLILEV